MTNSANPLRGEAVLLVSGRPLILRPTFQNLVLAEEELGSLFALVERASAGSLTLSEMTALIWHCLPDVDRPAREAVGEAVLAVGLVGAAKPVRAILAQVLQGDG